MPLTSFQMAPRRWASPEEEEFVYTFYEQYQQCQARRDYSTFWKPFYEAWGAKFPKWLVVFPEIPLDEELNGEQKQIVSKAYEEQKLVCTSDTCLPLPYTDTFPALATHAQAS